jgi:hypothetical protein
VTTTTTIQLDPPITVMTPRGKAEVYFKTEYGPDSYTIFGCFMRDSGDYWEFRAPSVKLFWNETMGTGQIPPDSVKPKANPDTSVHLGDVVWTAQGKPDANILTRNQRSYAAAQQQAVPATMLGRCQAPPCQSPSLCMQRQTCSMGLAGQSNQKAQNQPLSQDALAQQRSNDAFIGQAAQAGLEKNIDPVTGEKMNITGSHGRYMHLPPGFVPQGLAPMSSRGKWLHCPPCTTPRQCEDLEACREAVGGRRP